jgi:hypothetical protein
MPPSERYIMLVTVDIPPEREAAWNDWYNNEHVPDILKCPGFRAVRRFRSVQGTGTRYVTLYDVDGPAVRETEDFKRVRGWYQFTDDVIEPRISIYREFFSAER